MTSSRRAALVLILFVPILLVRCLLFPGAERERPGALDQILLSEKSLEAGPMILNHRLHYLLRDERGAPIECRFCHHAYEGTKVEPPRACSSCHPSHTSVASSDLPFL